MSVRSILLHKQGFIDSQKSSTVLYEVFPQGTSKLPKVDKFLEFSKPVRSLTLVKEWKNPTSTLTFILLFTFLFLKKGTLHIKATPKRISMLTFWDMMSFDSRLICLKALRTSDPLTSIEDFTSCSTSRFSLFLKLY